jgi:excisionase family DNA binding protein
VSSPMSTRMTSSSVTPLLTTREVADVFRVSARTVTRWISADLLPAVRIGKKLLVQPNDVVALTRRGRK